MKMRVCVVKKAQDSSSSSKFIVRAHPDQKKIYQFYIQYTKEKSPTPTWTALNDSRYLIAHSRFYLKIFLYFRSIACPFLALLVQP